MTKVELYEQIDSMTDGEAAQVKLIFAPDWLSKATSIEEIRGSLGPEVKGVRCCRCRKRPR
jgi:hypothetical protein